MLGSIWNFMKRHRRKFLVSGVVIGGIYYAGRYARRKLQDLQDQEAAECLSHARRQHHFDSNQRTCNMTVLSMLPSIREALLRNIDTEELTEELKTKPANKLQIWEELKILSFTRSVTAVYCVSMMIVLLRVQLNIIGGYMYLDTLQNQNSMCQTAENTIATPEVQGQYLSSVQYLVNEDRFEQNTGFICDKEKFISNKWIKYFNLLLTTAKRLVDLIAVVRKEVEKTIGKIGLKEQISLLKLQTVINHIRQEMEHRKHNGYYDGAGSVLTQFMLPPQENAIAEASQLPRQEIVCRKLGAETRDMVESGDFHAVLTTCLDTGFNRLLDKMAEFYKPSTHRNGTVFNPNDVSMPLAKVIPVMNGLVHTICADAPNPYVQELILKEHVKNFAANVYEAFSQSEQTPA